MQAFIRLIIISIFRLTILHGYGRHGLALFPICTLPQSVPVRIPTAQNLMNYFTEKIENIHRETGGSPVFSELAPPGLTFGSFWSYDADEVRKIITTTPHIFPTHSRFNLLPSISSISCSNRPSIPPKWMDSIIPKFRKGAHLTPAIIAP